MQNNKIPSCKSFNKECDPFIWVVCKFCERAFKGETFLVRKQQEQLTTMSQMYDASQTCHPETVTCHMECQCETCTVPSISGITNGKSLTSTILPSIDDFTEDPLATSSASMRTSSLRQANRNVESTIRKVEEQVGSSTDNWYTSGANSQSEEPFNLSRTTKSTPINPPTSIEAILNSPLNSSVGPSTLRSLEKKIIIDSGSTFDDGKQFHCSYCKRGYTSKLSLARHMRVHNGEQPFSCRFKCGKRFSRIDNRKIHERIHNGERPYKCGHCEISFSQLSNAKTHVLNQHPSLSNFST